VLLDPLREDRDRVPVAAQIRGPASEPDERVGVVGIAVVPGTRLLKLPLELGPPPGRDLGGVERLTQQGRRLRLGGQARFCVGGPRFAVGRARFAAPAGGQEGRQEESERDGRMKRPRAGSLAAGEGSQVPTPGGLRGRRVQEGCSVEGSATPSLFSTAKYSFLL
jgi:hypothetical protein